MAIINLNKTKKQVIIPQFSTYEVVEDGVTSFKVKLTWSADNDSDIVGFKIYKFNLPKTLIKSQYFITQNALQDLSSIYHVNNINTNLYNLSVFSQNSKVNIINDLSGATQRKSESEITQYNYRDFAFIRKNKTKNYEIFDKNIKFGETYSYIITAISNNGREGITSKNVLVNIEDAAPSAAPELCCVTSSYGIELSLSSSDPYIVSYEIFKRKPTEKQFLFLAAVDKKGNDTVFIDRKVFPGRDYEYKVFSIDYYNNRSYDSNRIYTFFQGTSLRKKNIPEPSFKLDITQDYVKFTGYKNNDDIIGYRLERKDDWLYQLKYEIKTYNDIPWPNVIIFNDKDECEQYDYTANDKAKYSYRITSIKKNGAEASYSFIKNLIITGSYSIEKNYQKKAHEYSANILSFNSKILDSAQRPLYVKFTWNISGSWDHALISGTHNQNFDNDSRVNFILIPVQPNQNNFYYLYIYDINDNLLDTSSKILLNT